MTNKSLTVPQIEIFPMSPFLKKIGFTTKESVVIVIDFASISKTALSSILPR